MLLHVISKWRMQQKTCKPSTFNYNKGMNTTSERGNEKCKSLRKSLSETIGLIMVLYCVYLFANLVIGGYLKDQSLTKVLLDFLPK